MEATALRTANDINVTMCRKNKNLIVECVVSVRIGKYRCMGLEGLNTSPLMTVIVVRVVASATTMWRGRTCDDVENSGLNSRSAMMYAFQFLGSLL